MVHPVAVAGFLVAILPLIATPGASLALLVQYVTDGGRRRALPVVLGTVTGLYVHAALAAAGLSALVMHSSVAFTVVRLIGAVYLIGLGVWTWRTATPAPRRRPRRRTDSVYVQALLANVLNPKAAAIYLTLVPQFVTPQDPLPAQILTLATSQALLITLWLTAWTFLILRATRILQTPRFKRRAARATSAILIALGVRAAVA
ncbi:MULTISPECIES: LysE family translocator [unclassified Streptomyces]|uniref:LysE family translocator n=1 Tax=unclassified Streptomyces TaxID=2593676 RepID=UPI00035E2D56|nr:MULTISPECIES: LysE family translocator [unclassified Streptomyces]MYQ78323.1 LysE family transporter [Streptomyces sp. SID4923]